MKKLALYTTLLLLITSLPVSAEEAKTLRETKLENRQEIRDAVKSNREEIKEIRVENRQEVRSMVAENHANRLERRFRYYYQRLSGIATRIQQRLETQKSEGKDTTAALTKLQEAKSKLESAKSLSEQAVAAFRSIDPARFEEQKTQALGARDLANQARVTFKDALALLKTVLKEVK
jgi:hypothetical protein